MTTHSDQDMHEHPGLEEPRPGHELRGARERAGISQESIAERLRLADDQVDALEHDDYPKLPAPAFVRGYLRAYARELGLDPEQYIAAYNRSGVSASDPAIRSGGVTDATSGGRGGLIGLLLIVLVAAGGIGAWWYQQRMGDGNGDSGAADSVEEEPTAAGESSADTDIPDAVGVDMDTDATAAAASAGDEAADAEIASVDVEAAGATTATAGNGDEDAADDVGGAGGSGEVGEAADDEAAGDETAGDEAEQPVVVATDRGSPDSGGEGVAGEGMEAADARNDDGDAGRTEDEPDDIAATDEAEGDTGADSTAAAAEPGATSPAATDSPTRAATDAASSGPDEITLGFSSRSWLEVYDDRDRELVYTLYFGSEPITLQGWAPFEIFLGNSPAVTVQFNGDEVDKDSFTRSNNTARFVVDASGVRAP